VNVSVLVRRAVDRERGQGDLMAQPAGATRAAALTGSIMKLSHRLTDDEATRLDAGERQAGLSCGAFIAGLLAQVPVLSGGASNRMNCLATLTASNAELSTLSCNLNHLTQYCSLCSSFRSG
jgi:hypothetical protein